MHKLTLFLFCIIFSAFTVGFADHADKTQNPFTPKAFVIRYWDRVINNHLPKPSFIISKASPLSAADATAFAKHIADNTLSTKLPEFCSAAHLLCFPDVNPSLAKHSQDSKFSVYNDGQNFTNYGTERPGGLDSFKNYSNGFESNPINEFRQYSRSSAGHNDSFTNYADSTNVADQSFNTYGSAAAGGAGEFKEYAKDTNVPNLRFTTYSVATAGRQQTFSSYSENGNAGDQSFGNYGKDSAGAENNFKQYGTDSNVASSGFTSYADKGTGNKDTFTNYGVNMNNPTEDFKNYARGSLGVTEKFSNYRDQSNVGADSFTSYAKDAETGTHVDFNNYGKSFNEGTDTFKGYAKGAGADHKVTFKGYGLNNTFKDYDKKGISFAKYTNASSSSINAVSVSDSLAKKWVEPGKFFREMMLKQGVVMPMPDIKDKLPQRSFLPRNIFTKLPFATSKLNELKQVFKVSENSSMDKMIVDSLGECERAPSKGETKRCVGSLEDMIDFATSVLGHDVTVRSTENLNGSGKSVMVGQVKGINGGKVTQSVSCHQSLFPSLLYYCHSVPKVRVYEADLLDPESKAKINHGVAICHLDTTAWSPTHGAFMALGSGPGRIEVCHWIFENDMTWTTTTD
ncbi:polygalacturonase non-catalytic subunit AroGP2-like [Vicia villosa]|uniref:polygalacturonase non-catalytic subunit AroGP2-like n=1 Tax=Vicia villosa TaxID=3911 RepID=UPI00273BA8A5|nr:polygalacturonase non-catalytic subunit AroGP2-like [Vicia villosa]